MIIRIRNDSPSAVMCGYAVDSPHTLMEYSLATLPVSLATECSGVRDRRGWLCTRRIKGGEKVVIRYLRPRHK
jgi:hypothetical protein